jgi:hypothetical protein
MRSRSLRGGTTLRATLGRGPSQGARGTLLLTRRAPASPPRRGNVLAARGGGELGFPPLRPALGSVSPLPWAGRSRGSFEFPAWREPIGAARPRSESPLTRVGRSTARLGSPTKGKPMGSITVYLAVLTLVVVALLVAPGQSGGPCERTSRVFRGRAGVRGASRLQLPDRARRRARWERIRRTLRLDRVVRLARLD